VLPSDCYGVESRKTFISNIRRGGQKVKTTGFWCRYFKRVIQEEGLFVCNMPFLRLPLKKERGAILLFCHHTRLRLRFHRRCARMRSEECVRKEPIESLHLPRLGQHSSGGNGSAELYFCAYKTSEGCVRGMCVEKDVLLCANDSKVSGRQALALLRSHYTAPPATHFTASQRILAPHINAHFHSSATHPRRHIFIAQLW
jgi:hypothetical protein